MLRRLRGAYRAAFAGFPREVWILAAATFVNRSGTMVLPFLALYLTRRLGFSIGTAGRLIALYGVGAIAGSFIGGWLADRVGPVRVQVASLLSTGVGFLVLSRAHSPLAVATALLGTSLLAEWVRPASLVAAAEHSPPEVRARALALLRLAVNLGMACGPLLGGLLAVKHYGLLFAADALTCWAAALLLWTSLGRRERLRSMDPLRATATGGSPWRDGPFLALLGCVLLWGVAFGQVFGTFPLALRAEYGLSEAKIGALLALNGLMIVASEMLLVRALEPFARLRVAAVGSLLVGAGFGLLAFDGHPGVAIASVVVWTTGEMLSLPMFNVVVADRANATSRGAYMGAYTLAFSAAFVLAPWLGAAVYERSGAAWLWSGVAAVGAVLALLLQLLSRRWSAATATATGS